jgi:hypothetical protein
MLHFEPEPQQGKVVMSHGVVPAAKAGAAAKVRTLATAIVLKEIMSLPPCWDAKVHLRMRISLGAHS